MKVKSESEVSQSCPTLSDPMGCSLPGSSVHGIFQARVLEWGVIAFSGWIPDFPQTHCLIHLFCLECSHPTDPHGSHLPLFQVLAPQATSSIGLHLPLYLKLQHSQQAPALALLCHHFIKHCYSPFIYLVLFSFSALESKLHEGGNASLLYCRCLKLGLQHSRCSVDVC